MIDPYIAAVIALVGSIITGLITAQVTARLALRRFYSEKWWERKAAAYVAVLESLHHILADIDADLEEMIDGRERSAEQRAEDTAKYKAARAEIAKHIDLGELLISEEAVQALRNLNRVLYGSQYDYHEYLSMGADRSALCLRQVKRIARADLRLDPWWRRLWTWIARSRGTACGDPARFGSRGGTG